LADQVTTQILHDGPRNCVVKLTSISDGTDETLVTKVAAEFLSGAPSSLKVTRIQYDLSPGMQVTLAWKDPANTEFALLSPGPGDMDFSDIGGLINPMKGNANGDIVLTSVADNLSDTYTIILHMVKKYS
jgi:hypothetical protein